MRKIEYLEWVKLRQRAKYEISGSGVMPVHIAELPEARDAMDLNDFNLYGYRPLLKRIATHHDVSPEQVVTTQGTSMANYLAYQAMLRAGDEVLVESPAYEPLLAIPELLGIKVRRFERHFSDGFALDPREVEKNLTKRTKLIAITNMHNPSGVLATADQLREIGRLARKQDAYVLVDEVYLDFLFESRPQSSVHLGPNFIVTSSLTKVYGLDGLRCGWILASPKIAKEIWRLNDFYGANGAVPAEQASTVAFEHLDRFASRTRTQIAANRPLIDEFMQAQQQHLKWIAPEAGPVCFPKLKQGSCTEFVERLRTKYEVGLIPGHFFEMPRHFRLGFGGPTEELREGLRRMEEALNA